MNSSEPKTIRQAIHCTHRSQGRHRETIARFSTYYSHYTSTDIPREFAEEVATDKTLTKIRREFVTDEELRWLEMAAHYLQDAPDQLQEKITRLARKIARPE